MTNYEITVNGKSYDVTVRKKKPTSTTSVSETKNVAPVVQAPAPTATTVSTAGSVGKKVVAPMPGKIIAVKVSVGVNVKKGQEMIIMEAMKMHNPILAANDGVITEIFVQVNDPVQSGQALLAIGS